MEIPSAAVTTTGMVVTPTAKATVSLAAPAVPALPLIVTSADSWVALALTVVAVLLNGTVTEYSKWWPSKAGLRGPALNAKPARPA